jgi:hypothetical protein
VRAEHEYSRVAAAEGAWFQTELAREAQSATIKV